MLSRADLMAFLPSDDLDRARTFFTEVIGLPLVEHDPYACVFDANGTQLRVTLVEPFTRAPHTVLGWLVPDIAAATRALASRGLHFERYKGMGQDSSGVWTAPSGDLVAWFKDPDGNTLSLTQSAAGAE
jgi:catechol 2,3-dioxygenase-like lactoylglutathione lyase family enzyme